MCFTAVPSATISQSFTGSVVYPVNSGDTFGVYIYHDQGGSLTFYSNSFTCYQLL